MYASSITGACLFHLNGAQCEIRTRKTQGLSLRCLPIAPTERMCWYPERASNPQQLGFKPSASAHCAIGNCGAETWDRTKHACAFNAALYRLSYLGNIHENLWRTVAGSNRWLPARQAGTLPLS